MTHQDQDQLTIQDLYYINKSVFQVVSTKFFHIISIEENSTLFWHALLDVISMDKKTTSFPYTFLMLFQQANIQVILKYFFDVISIDRKSTQFQRPYFAVFKIRNMMVVLTFLFVKFQFIKNENGSEHLHYLLSDLIWTGCNYILSELEKFSGNC